MDMFSILAEAMINESLRCQANEVTLPVSFDNQFFDLPDDYLEARSIKLSKEIDAVPIAQVALVQLERYRRAGTPLAYAIHSGTIEFSSVIDPTAPFDGEMIYYADVDPLSSSPSDTNPVLDKYPLLYLSAMLFHANGYAQDDEQSQKWLGIYTSQLAKINKTSKKGRYVLPSVR